MVALAETIATAKASRAFHLSEASKASRTVAVKTAILHAQENALALVQQVARETMDQLKLRIESIVQEALDAVFPEGGKFKVDYETKNDRTQASIYIEVDGERMDPLADDGGGLADVLAFALRLVAWSLGKSENTLILDEPGKGVSKEYRPMLIEMISGLSSQLGLQTIIVTHDPDIMEMADRTFRVSLGEGRVSKVEVK